jgi:hypothetical protein
MPVEFTDENVGFMRCDAVSLSYRLPKVGPVNTTLTQRHIILAFNLSPQQNLRGNNKSRENWNLVFNEAFDHAYEINL